MGNKRRNDKGQRQGQNYAYSHRERRVIQYRRVANKRHNAHEWKPHAQYQVT